MRLSKTTQLKDGRKLFAFWANNKGRGTNNCTLQLAEPNGERGYRSNASTGVISQARTSSWAGDVNLSKKVLEELGISKETI